MASDVERCPDTFSSAKASVITLFLAPLQIARGEGGLVFRKLCWAPSATTSFLVEIPVSDSPRCLLLRPIPGRTDVSLGSAFITDSRKPPLICLENEKGLR